MLEVGVKLKKNSNIPPVHKKVKKKDLLVPVALIVVLVIFLVIIIIHTFKFFPSFTKNYNLAGIAGAFVAVYALIWQIYSTMKARKIVVRLELIPKVEGTNVTFSCSVNNAGTKSIYPYMVNLYIDEGVFNAKKSLYEFDPITNHTIDRRTGEVFDCHLAQFCKKEDVLENGCIGFPPCQDDKFITCDRYCFNLRQLSHYTLVHIMPNETFSEDLVMEIKKDGVYRVTLIYTGKDYDDCICATKKFRILKGEIRK